MGMRLVKNSQDRNDKEGRQEDCAHAGRSTNIMVKFWLRRSASAECDGRGLCRATSGTKRGRRRRVVLAPLGWCQAREAMTCERR